MFCANTGFSPSNAPTSSPPFHHLPEIRQDLVHNLARLETDRVFLPHLVLEERLRGSDLRRRDHFAALGTFTHELGTFDSDLLVVRVLLDLDLFPVVGVDNLVDLFL